MISGRGSAYGSTGIPPRTGNLVKKPRYLYGMEEVVEFFQVEKPPGAAAFRDAVAYCGADLISDAIGGLDHKRFPWEEWFCRRSKSPTQSAKIQMALEPVFALAPRARTPSNTICNFLMIAICGKNVPVILRLLKELKRGRGRNKKFVLSWVDEFVSPDLYTDFDTWWDAC